MAIEDVRTDPRTAAHAARYDRWGIGSMMLAPGVSGGRWKLLTVLHKPSACTWRDDEVGLFREAATHVHLRLERARSEEALRAAHDTFRHLVDNSPFGVYAVDTDFRLVQVSPGAASLQERPAAHRAATSPRFCGSSGRSRSPRK